jgi:hypothetical protein
MKIRISPPGQTTGRKAKKFRTVKRRNVVLKIALSLSVLLNSALLYLILTT